MQKTIVITGASDGIGAAAARELSQQGNHVVLVGRSQAKTAAVAQELAADYFTADFSHLSQVRDLAAELLNKYAQIDVLANNAGGIMGSREVTADGFEKTFQVNHLAPFLLTNLLMPRLLESGATVINTSSAANSLMARFHIDDLQGERGYTASRAYGNAKLANILFTQELQNRFGEDGISAAAFHPGIVGTSFSAESTGLFKSIYSRIGKRFMLTPKEGADTLIWLATTTPGTDWAPGEYYSKRALTKANPLAYRPELAKELWDRSAAMVELDG